MYDIFHNKKLSERKKEKERKKGRKKEKILSLKSQSLSMNPFLPLTILRNVMGFISSYVKW